MWARGLAPYVASPVGFYGPAYSAASSGGFDPGPIDDIVVVRRGAELFITWKSSAPSGSWYQVYINGRLIWDGQATNASIPFAAPAGSRVYVNVGVVGWQNVSVDYGASISMPRDRALLSWSAGRYQHPNPYQFLVFASPGPGQDVAMTSPVATVRSAPGGVWPPDGFGAGRYGRGGFGHAEIRYTWTSGSLAPGVWSFRVASADRQGNYLDPSATVEQTIVAPPASPPPRSDGRRLWVQSYDATTRTYSLGWNPAT